MYRRLILLIAIFISIIGLSINVRAENLNEEKYISVEIQGEVEKPGIYKMKLGSTMDDLFKESIPKENADISQYSLQNVLYNSEVIVVKEYDQKLISINTATLQELISLPGIGETIGKRIIEYRDKYGSFNTLEDLMNVSGIGNVKFNKLKEYISL